MPTVVAYHMVSSGQLASVLQHGLRQGTRGSKGSDQAIIDTDELLDELCPQHLISAGVSRAANIYAYLPDGEAVIDIADGVTKPPRDLADIQGHRLLRLEVFSDYCFVSDLDTYDAVLAAVRSDEHISTLQQLATSYWHKFTPLEGYVQRFRRPELVITTNIGPQQVTPVL